MKTYVVALKRFGRHQPGDYIGVTRGEAKALVAMKLAALQPLESVGEPAKDDKKTTRTYKRRDMQAEEVRRPEVRAEPVKQEAPKPSVPSTAVPGMTTNSALSNKPMAEKVEQPAVVPENKQ